MEEHTQIIQWFIGIILVIGGSMLGVFAKMMKNKRNKIECDLIHKAVADGITDIKQRLEKGDVKIDGMKETLVEISTTLKVRSQDETDRYVRHTEEWKDK